MCPLPVGHYLPLLIPHSWEVHPHTSFKKAKEPKRDIFTPEEDCKQQTPTRQRHYRLQQLATSHPSLISQNLGEEHGAKHHGAHEAREDDAEGERAVVVGEEVGGFESGGPEEDEKVHGAFETAGC